MEVTVNGAQHEVPDGLTVRGLVVHLGLTEGPVAVEINREIVPRASHPTHRVAGGDTIRPSQQKVVSRAVRFDERDGHA